MDLGKLRKHLEILRAAVSQFVYRECFLHGACCPAQYLGGVFDAVLHDHGLCAGVDLVGVGFGDGDFDLIGRKIDDCDQRVIGTDGLAILDMQTRHEAGDRRADSQRLDSAFEFVHEEALTVELLLSIVEFETDDFRTEFNTFFGLFQFE